MLTKDDKIRQIKTALIKVLSVVKQQFPWLDYKQVKYGRDQSLSDDKGTTVRLYFQQCLTKDGKEIESWYGYEAAEYYEEIYNNVEPILRQYFKDDPQIEKIKSGTFSHIVDIPEINKLEAPHYGIIIDINYIHVRANASPDTKAD